MKLHGISVIWHEMATDRKKKEREKRKQISISYPYISVHCTNQYSWDTYLKLQVQKRVAISSSFFSSICTLLLFSRDNYNKYCATCKMFVQGVFFFFFFTLAILFVILFGVLLSFKPAVSFLNAMKENLCVCKRHSCLKMCKNSGKLTWFDYKYLFCSKTQIVFYYH